MASFENQRIGAMSVQYMPYVEDKDRSQFEQLVSVGPAGRFGDFKLERQYVYMYDDMMHREPTRISQIPGPECRL